MRAAFVVIGIATLGAACTSPEATRMRAGGSGADVGNRKAVVTIHDGARPYFETPERLGKDVGMRDLDSARHADGLARAERR